MKAHSALPSAVALAISLLAGASALAESTPSVPDRSATQPKFTSKKTFVDGCYEACFKTPPAEGWHTAFWSMRHNAPDGKHRLPPMLELDFCEQDGGDPHYFSFGVINQSRYRQSRPDAWIAMFDINKPEDPINAGSIWLPVEFEADQPVIRWRDT